MNKTYSVRRFEDLRVWQMAIQLVKRVYLLTDSGPLKTDFGLKDQLRRASVSIPTNIAEVLKDFLERSTCCSLISPKVRLES